MDLQKIEAFRQLKKLTQDQFAKSLGVTSTGYQKMIRNNEMKLSFFIKICKTYQVSPLYFLEEDVQTNVITLNEPQSSYGNADYYKGLWESCQATVDSLNISVKAQAEIIEGLKQNKTAKRSS